MSVQLFTNNAIALLKTSITPSSIQIEVQPGFGALFPQPINAGDFFLITLEDVNPPLTREIIKITGRTGDILFCHITDRGMENTTPKSWDALQTLVDHRITAETIKQAFLQPVQQSGNLTTYQPIVVPVTSAEEVALVQYTDLSRANKFWVSMVDTISGNALAFECYTIIQGVLASNNEIVTYTISNRIGYNFKGHIQIDIDHVHKILSLTWVNQELIMDVVVSIIRI